MYALTGGLVPVPFYKQFRCSSETSMGTDVRLRRSFLFFPASRPDRYEKALATGTDVVCIDLEDGVASSAKEDAREKAFEILRQPQRGRVEVILRINDPKTELGPSRPSGILRVGHQA